MSFLSELEVALRGHRVPGRDRRRILAEYADHLACEPESAARLGEPAALAASFAAIRSSRGARRGAAGAVLALSLTAVAVFVGQGSIGAAGGSPGFQNGHSTVLAIVALAAIVFGSQVALVTGSLALLRVWRRRGTAALPDAEVALIHRRSLVALGAGLSTAAGLLLYAVDFEARLATWWLWLQVAVALVAGAAMIAALVAILRSRRVRGGVAGPAGGLDDDLPPLRALVVHPWALCALVTVAVAGLVTAGTGQAERSLAEGAQRGFVEALAIVACFALLGRAVGLRGEAEAG